MKKKTTVYVGMDVHEDTVMIAGATGGGSREATAVKRLSHDLRALRLLLDPLCLGRQGEIRACYKASGAGYVLERRIRGSGHCVRH